MIRLIIKQVLIQTHPYWFFGSLGTSNKNCSFLEVSSNHRSESDKLNLDPKRFLWCKNMYKKTWPTFVGCSYITITLWGLFWIRSGQTFNTKVAKTGTEPSDWSGFLTSHAACSVWDDDDDYGIYISAFEDENAGVQSDNGRVVHTLTSLFVGRQNNRAASSQVSFRHFVIKTKLEDDEWLLETVQDQIIWIATDKNKKNRN